jgi:putative intracellular protease/amidase
MKKIGALVFPNFELLDMFGPLEMFALMGDEVEVAMIGQNGGVVSGRGGPKTQCDLSYDDDAAFDMLLVPGGTGAREEVTNPATLNWLRAQSEKTELVMTVCTGSTLLSATGLLDGRRATTNKRAFEWATSYGPNVDWVKQARWVEDGKYFTSSGVSAGMDMALTVIAQQFGLEAAERTAISAEYDWHRDADYDPFAKIHGLV